MKIIVTILASFIFSSCVTYTHCVDKFGQYPKDTVFVPVETPVEVSVPVPGDSIQTSFNTDSLKNGQVYTTGTDSSQFRIQYWKDLYSNLLTVKAKYKDRIVKDTIIIRDTIPCPPTPVLVEKPSKITTWWEKYKSYASWILPVVILFIAIGLFRRR